MPLFRPSERQTNVFLTQLRPHGVSGAQAGRAPEAVASALHNIFGFRSDAGWGSTESTRGRIWVQWVAFSPVMTGTRSMPEAQIADGLRRAVRSAEAQLGGGARLLLPGEAVPSRAAPTPPPATPPPPASAGTPEAPTAETSTGRPARRRRSRTPPASEAEAEFIAQGGEDAGSALPDWVVPVAVIGGVTVVSAIGILIWANRAPSRVSANRRPRRRRIKSNTHRSILLDRTEGDTWVVRSSNPDVQRVLTSMAGRGLPASTGSSAEPAMQWKLNRARRDMIWSALRSHLKSERASRDGLVHWADQRVYDFFSPEHA